MTEIKQEWLKEARQAAFVVATDDNVSTMLGNASANARAILEAVAPLIRADALREAEAASTYVVDNWSGAGCTLIALGAYKVRSRILALIDATKMP